MSEEIVDLSMIPLKRSNGSNYAQIAVLTCSLNGTSELTYFELENSFLDESKLHIISFISIKLVIICINYRTSSIV